MKIQRGDVVLVVFPFTSGAGSKLRPALIVQSDLNNKRLGNVIVAAITTTTHRSGQPTQLLLGVATPTGQQAGILKDSVVTCENLATVDQGIVSRKIGTLPANAMEQINHCLMAALGIA